MSKKPTSSSQTIFSATHGRPHLGGAFSDFIGKYGKPVDTTSQPYTFLTGAGQNTIISVELQSQNVTHVLITGQDGWSYTETSNFCSQFAPNNSVARGPAAMTGSDSSAQLFDSASGRFSIFISQNTCQLYFAQR